MASTMRLAMARPRPVPPDCREMARSAAERAEQALVVFRAMPMPESSTSMHAARRAFCVRLSHRGSQELGTQR